MNINTVMEGEVAVIDIAGDVVASTSGKIKDEVQALTEKGCFNVVLELGQVGFLDSTGLSVCMGIHEMLLKNSGTLVLARPGEGIRKVLRITGADQKIKTAESRQDGISMAGKKSGGDKG